MARVGRVTGRHDEHRVVGELQDVSGLAADAGLAGAGQAGATQHDQVGAPGPGCSNTSRATSPSSWIVWHSTAWVPASCDT